MADFAPTTALYFFKDTRVSPQNQPYFTSESSKIAWYASHDTKVFTQYSYQRENRQYVRIEAKADEMRSFDMFAFKNGDGKTIFCRILEVEFVNPNTTQITFETDRMQTFIENIEFQDSWVEREMQRDDWNGSLPSFNNLMPEGLESGGTKKILLADTSNDIAEAGADIVVLSAYDSLAEPNYNITGTGMYFNGLNKITMSAGGMEGLLATYAEKGRLDGIVGVWCVPKLFNTDSGYSFTKVIQLPSTIDGYQPQNAKCFSGEFCTVELSNRMGQSAHLMPEYLVGEDGWQATLQVQGEFAAGTGGVFAYFTEYYGNVTGFTDFGVSLPLNAQTCCVGNAYANWVAQNISGLALEGVSNVSQLISGAVSAGAGMASGNLPMMGLGARSVGQALYNSLNTMGALYQKSRNSASVVGGSNSSGFMMATNRFGFTVYFNCPPAAVIESIDNFFTMYGYRTCRAKKPNVDTRPFWNYIKCAPAVVSGPFTQRDKEEIEAILNAGVTFWHVTNGAVIGDYSKDNRG